MEPTRQAQPAHPAKAVERAEALRGFNRFYTETIGALDEQHEGLAVSLGQSRMLHAVSRLTESEVSTLADALQLDLAYTSRLLGSLENRGLVSRSVSDRDRRRRTVVLTNDGRTMLAELEDRSNQRMLRLVEHLSDAETDQVLDAMTTIRRLMSHPRPDAEPTEEHR